MFKVIFENIIFVNLFYYLIYFYYYLWVSLYYFSQFLFLLMVLSVKKILFQQNKRILNKSEIWFLENCSYYFPIWFKIGLWMQVSRFIFKI